MGIEYGQVTQFLLLAGWLILKYEPRFGGQRSILMFVFLGGSAAAGPPPKVRASVLLAGLTAVFTPKRSEEKGNCYDSVCVSVQVY